MRTPNIQSLYLGPGQAVSASCIRLLDSSTQVLHSASWAPYSWPKFPLNHALTTASVSPCGKQGHCAFPWPAFKEQPCPATGPRLLPSAFYLRQRCGDAELRWAAGRAQAKLSARPDGPRALPEPRQEGELRGQRGQRGGPRLTAQEQRQVSRAWGGAWTFCLRKEAGVGGAREAGRGRGVHDLDSS